MIAILLFCLFAALQTGFPYVKQVLVCFYTTVRIGDTLRFVQLLARHSTQNVILHLSRQLRLARLLWPIIWFIHERCAILL